MKFNCGLTDEEKWQKRYKALMELKAKALELVKINAASIILHLRDSYKSHAAESVCDVIADRIMRME